MNYILRLVTMNRILLLFFTLLIYGCATKLTTNLNVLGYSNFHENLSKSSSFIELKNYLLKNNMKLGGFVMLSGSPNTTYGLGNVGLDGDRKSFFVTDENKNWLRNTMKSFVLSEFSAFMYDSEGLNLSYCGDFANAIIGDNGEFGTIEYTYFLSNMTEVQRQIFLKQQALDDCNYDAVLGDVFYKKKVKVNSSPTIAKLIIIKKDENYPITSLDNLSLTVTDQSVQAMTAMLTDADLLQALKDYKLTGGKKLAEPAVINKTPVSESTTTTTNNQVPAVNMEKYKTQCKELGFKLGTTDYGNCVLQLMK